MQRWLVQLGFGPAVYRVAPGTEIALDTKMRRMSAKFSTGERPSNALVNHIAKYISEFAVDSVVARLNGTFTFLCHRQAVRMEYCVKVVMTSIPLNYSGYMMVLPWRRHWIWPGMSGSMA